MHFLIIFIFILPCRQSIAQKIKKSGILDTTKGLKDYYYHYFPIGVAVSAQELKSADSVLILKQFNSLTPENAMKMGPIHPMENVYNWKDADSIVAFARRHHLFIRGHNLCWHNQAPAWIFNEGNKRAGKELLLKRLKEHIQTVVSHYKGSVYAWDVVNEAVSDKPEEYLRNSLWLQISGEEYIARAFEYAHEADPGALLFYNDYNEINSVKREKIFRLVKGLVEAGVPINGVGLQGHWAINEPGKEQLDSTIKLFASLGLKVQITELDISVYSKEHSARERRPEDDQDQFTSEREKKQIEEYKTCFTVFNRNIDLLNGITFWNITDKHSWLDNFPVTNRKDYPLLFDINGQPKKAFYAVAQLATELKKNKMLH